MQWLCFWEEQRTAWHYSFLSYRNSNFTLAECLRLLIRARVLLKRSFWDASALTSCWFHFQPGLDELCCSFTSQAPWMLMEGVGWECSDFVQQPLGYHSDRGTWMCWSEEIQAVTELWSQDKSLFYANNQSFLSAALIFPLLPIHHYTNIICGFQCVCILNTARITHLELDPKQAANWLYHMKITLCLLAGIWFWRHQKCLWGVDFGTLHVPSSSVGDPVGLKLHRDSESDWLLYPVKFPIF